MVEVNLTNGGLKRNLFFWVMSAVGAFAILSSTMSKNPVLPLLAKSLGAKGPDLGFIAAASTVPGIIVSLPAGSLSDLMGRRKVVFFSLAVFATAPLLYLLVHTAWQLVLVRFYHGFATAIFGPVANAIIAEKFPKQKGERISLFSSATIVGRSAAPFIGGTILYMANMDFNLVYLIVELSAVTALILAVLFYKEVDQPKRESQRKETKRVIFLDMLVAWRKISKDIRILVTSSVESVQFLTFGAFEFFLVLYANSIGLDSFQIGVISGAQLISVVFSKPLMGRLSDRLGRRPIIISGLMLGSAALFLAGLTHGFLPLLGVSILYGVGFATVTSSTAAFVSDLTTRQDYGSAMGFLSTIMDVGQAMGPIITAFALEFSDYKGAFQILGALMFLVFIPFFLVTHGRTKA